MGFRRSLKVQGRTGGFSKRLLRFKGGLVGFRRFKEVLLFFRRFKKLLLVFRRSRKYL